MIFLNLCLPIMVQGIRLRLSDDDRTNDKFSPRRENAAKKRSQNFAGEKKRDPKQNTLHHQGRCFGEVSSLPMFVQKLTN